MSDQGDPDSRSLAELIREHREAAGFSIRQLAGLVGAHHSLLARIESGDVTRPGVELLQRLSEVLEIDPIVLFEAVGIKPVLPEPRVYFRRAYGMSEVEAEEAARIIAELRKEHGHKDSS